MKKRTAIITAAAAAAAFAIGCINNPMAPQETQDNTPQFPNDNPTYVMPDGGKFNTQQPAINNDPYANWIHIADIEVAVRRDGSSEILGFCPMYSERGDFPGPMPKEYVMIVLPNGDRIFPIADGMRLCREAAFNLIFDEDPGGLFTVRNCKQLPSSIKQPNRTIPQMGDR